MIHSIWQDLVYGFRIWRRSTTFAVAVAVSLGLGIGANTAIFWAIDTVILRSLPVRNPKELVAFRDRYSFQRYRKFSEANEVLSGLFGAYTVSTLHLTQPGATEDEPVVGELVTGNYFDVLGITTVLGRPLRREDDLISGSSPVAVVSFDFWKRRLGGGQEVIGKELRVQFGGYAGGAYTSGLEKSDITTDQHRDGVLVTIVGVAPRGFWGDTVEHRVDLWMPVMIQPALMPGRSWITQPTGWLMLMGRRKAGVSESQARAELTVVWHQILTNERGIAISEQRRRQILQSRLYLDPGDKGFSGFRRVAAEPLYLLLAVAGLVLLIAVVNIANLLLARGAERRKEIAIRSALGAQRSRVVRQLLTESVLLSAVGSVLGLLLARWGAKILFSLVSVESPLSADPYILAFNAAVSVLAGLLFGTIPAWQMARAQAGESLRHSGRATASRTQVTIINTLLMFQVGLSLLMVLSASLFVRTLHNLKIQQMGYNPERLVLMRVDPTSAGYREREIVRLCGRILDRIAQIPGVRTVTFSENGLFSGTDSDIPIEVDGRTDLDARSFKVYFDQVGPDYFASLGIPLLFGRGITAQDTETSGRVVVINESLSRTYFGSTSAIGKHLRTKIGGNGYDMEIVGVSRDVRDHSLREQGQRRFYVPFSQSIDRVSTVNFEVRTVAAASSVMPRLRREAQTLDGHLPIVSLRTLEELIDKALLEERLIARLSTAFAVLSLLLAAVGLYGVTSYTVAKRTAEFGIRIALGARAAQLTRMIVWQTLRLVFAGVVLGFPIFLLAARLIRSRLFGLAPTDPLTIAFAILFLHLVALVAAYVPARSACRVEPAIALRQE